MEVIEIQRIFKSHVDSNLLNFLSYPILVSYQNAAMAFCQHHEQKLTTIYLSFVINIQFLVFSHCRCRLFQSNHDPIESSAIPERVDKNDNESCIKYS